MAEKKKIKIKTSLKDIHSPLELTLRLKLLAEQKPGILIIDAIGPYKKPKLQEKFENLVKINRVSGFISKNPIKKQDDLIKLLEEIKTADNNIKNFCLLTTPEIQNSNSFRGKKRLISAIQQESGYPYKLVTFKKEA